MSLNETIKGEYQHYNYSENELKEELEEAIKNDKKELEIYNSTQENRFVNGIVFHPETNLNKDVFVKIIEKSKSETTSYSEQMVNRNIAECIPEEQIVKIIERKIRKRHLEHD
ncbi:hypothetical protein BZARG_2206 [Bizionia argentinensis JUB59]|uniref:Uncharacterized protein n=1 Tax=Bizionia argentinensis JUB59 TaxID=1046627 RepID=G2EG98_9FLAO|nr:hypothetical protein [Bizionia argentinensis]EGV42539.1 hypothetical protein BZARG_2206 [Bizionia argentinensis JUB59]